MLLRSVRVCVCVCVSENYIRWKTPYEKLAYSYCRGTSEANKTKPKPKTRVSTKSTFYTI